jgi:hypothetical protein
VSPVDFRGRHWRERRRGVISYRRECVLYHFVARRVPRTRWATVADSGHQIQSGITMIDGIVVADSDHVLHSLNKFKIHKKNHPKVTLNDLFMT